MDTDTTTQNKSWMKKVLSFLIQMIIIGLLAWYLYTNRDVLTSLVNIRLQQVVWLVVLELAMFLVNSYINYLMIHQLDQRVSFLDCFMLQYVNNLLNKILPTIGGGAAFRAYYLKKRYQFPYTHFVTTITGLYLISFCTTALIGILCMLIIHIQDKAINWYLMTAYIGIFISTIILIVSTPHIPNKEKRFFRILNNIIDSWKLIRKNTSLLISYALLSIILLLLSSAHTYIGYLSLGQTPDLVPMLYLSTLGIIMAFLNFTPDGLGIKEGLYVLSKDLVHIPEDVLVLGSLYLRGISIISTALIGGISYWWLMRTIKRLGPGNKITPRG